MEKMDLAFTGPPLYAPPQQGRRDTRTLVWLVLGSILVHLAIFTLMRFRSAPPVAPPKAPIKAVLYIPVPAPVRQPEPAIQSPLESDPVKQDVQTKSVQDSPPTSQPVDESPVDTSPPANNDMALAGEILTQSTDSPAPASRMVNRSVVDSINQGLKHRQSQQLESLAELSARERRKALTSPDLRIGEYDEPENVIGEYTVNCDKGVNSSIATVARLFGGNVKCNRRNEFQQFIDKRQHSQPEQ